jgi:hypothetical protein
VLRREFQGVSVENDNPDTARLRWAVENKSSAHAPGHQIG